MRDIKRIRKFCNQFADLWEAYCPDIRFGQLIEILFKNGIPDGKDPFYIEDQELMAFIKTYLKEMRYEK